MAKQVTIADNPAFGGVSAGKVTGTGPSSEKLFGTGAHNQFFVNTDQGLKQFNLEQFANTQRPGVGFGSSINAAREGSRLLNEALKSRGAAPIGFDPQSVGGVGGISNFAPDALRATPEFQQFFQGRHQGFSGGQATVDDIIAALSAGQPVAQDLSAPGTNTLQRTGAPAIRPTVVGQGDADTTVSAAGQAQQFPSFTNAAGNVVTPKTQAELDNLQALGFQQTGDTPVSAATGTGSPQEQEKAQKLLSNPFQQGTPEYNQFVAENAPAGTRHIGPAEFDELRQFVTTSFNNAGIRDINVINKAIEDNLLTRVGADIFINAAAPSIEGIISNAQAALQQPARPTTPGGAGQTGATGTEGALPPTGTTGAVPPPGAEGALGAAATGVGITPTGATTPTTDLTSSQQALLDLLKPGQREEDVQRQLDNLLASRELGLNKIEDQPIALPFITGQQASLQRSAATQAVPLQQELGRIQAQRQAAIDVSTTKLGFEEKAQARKDAAAAAQAKANEPIKIGDSLVQLDPATGQFVEVFKLTPETGPLKTQLTEVGGARVLINSQTGEVIANLGSSDSPLDIAKLNLEIAKAQRDATKLSPEAAKTVANVKSGISDIAKLRTQLKEFGSGTKLGFDKATLAARANVADVIGRMRSGGAITEDELKTFESLLPQTFETDATRTEKLNRLEDLFNDVLEGIQPGSTVLLDSNVDEQLNNANSAQDALDFSQDLSRSENGSLGSLSEKFESGGDPGAIGFDSTGGYSYGTFQLAHNNAKNFVNDSEFKDEFKGLVFNSPQWRSKWKEVAKNDPSGFENAQKQFIQKTHFDPQMEKIASAGFDANKFSPVLRDVIWSTAVQHGAGTNVITNVLNRLGKNASEADIIKEIYNERWSGGRRFASSTDAVKNGVRNRFFGQNGELQLALSRLNSANGLA